MKRCLLLDDGTVNYYLDPNDSSLKEDGTAAALDGSDGQVMVEIPEYYRKCTDNTDESYYDVEISLYEFAGATKIPKRYVGAFEACADRTDTSNIKLCSVQNLTSNFRGGHNLATWDNTERSLLGKPSTSITFTNFQLYGKNRGARWQVWDLVDYSSIYWLFAIEYATLNSQAAFSSDLSVEGYHKGGLGEGATTVNYAYWNNYCSCYPMIPIGISIKSGNFTDEIE